MSWHDQFRAKEWFSFLNEEASIATALILSIRFGDNESAKLLIPMQEDINERDHDGDWFPLLYAVNEEAPEIVMLLVEAGADVNQQGTFCPDEDFALNLAAHSKNKMIYEYLYSRTSSRLRAIAEQT